jgi:hypothetical protein
VEEAPWKNCGGGHADAVDPPVPARSREDCTFATGLRVHDRTAP